MTTHVRSTFIVATIAAVALAAAAPVPAFGQAGATADTARAPAAAPADTLLLPGLVVTATRVAVRPEALPTPVTVLTGATLRELGVRTVAEALRSVPGAAIVQAGPRGGQTSLFLRGGQSGYVKVMVDGVPVNDPGGAIDLADLTTDQVDRIEIVRGPVSVLYGSDAVAGVVQVFTRRGHGSPSLSITTTGGMGERRHEDSRYGAIDAAGTVTGASGPLAYAVGAGRSWNDGAYPFNSDRRIDVLNGRLDWQGQAGTTVSATARLSDSDTGLPTDGAGNLVDRNARLERRTWTAGLEADQRLGRRVVARLQLGLLDRDQLAHDEPDTPADTVGTYASRLHSTVRRLGVDARVDVGLPRSLASAGIAVHDQRGTTAYASESEWGPYAADAEFRRSNRGYYAQLLSEPLAGLHLTAGARIDDNEVFGTFGTHRLGLAYEIGQARIRGAVGRAFREPTFPESFGSGFGDRGNAALVPERSRSWEVGVDGQVTGSLRAGATWFDQQFHDMIQYTFATAEPDDPNYYNVGAAVARGLEVTADAATGRVQLHGSYTWLTTRVLDPGLATDASFAEGDRLLRRPAHSGALTARYQLTGGTLGVTVHRVGEREDMDFGAGYPAPRTTLPAYTTVHLSAERRLTATGGPAWDLVLRVQNALDARYEAVHGFPAPGRLIALGLRMRTGGR